MYYKTLFRDEWDWMYETTDLRNISAYCLADSLSNTVAPKIQMAIIAASNPVAQLSETTKLTQHLAKLDTVVVAGQFLTETAQSADVFLPTTTWLEHWDVVPGYWHNWLGVSEPAVMPRGQCLSDIEIVTKLSLILNRLVPGICTFPVKTEEEWLKEIFTPVVLASLQIEDYHELLLGPKEFKNLPQYITQGRFQTPSGKFVLSFTELSKSSVLYSGGTGRFPYRLLTPHVPAVLNSQFRNINEGAKACILIHPKMAQDKGILSGEEVLIFNQLGEIKVQAFVTKGIVPNAICYYAGEMKEEGINQLILSIPTDFGEQLCGGKGLAFNETFVNLVSLTRFR